MSMPLDPAVLVWARLPPGHWSLAGLPLPSDFLCRRPRLAATTGKHLGAGADVRSASAPVRQHLGAAGRLATGADVRNQVAEGERL